MRRVGQTRRRDANEPEIVDALESIGVKVSRLSGDGVPDLVAHHPHEGLRLIEVKTPRGVLTGAQQQFLADGWPVSIVTSRAEALALFGVKA